MRYYCIDRFEGDYAVCENEEGGYENILANLLPPDAKESDWFSLSDDGIYRLEPERTTKQREKAKKLLEQLFSKDAPE